MEKEMSVITDTLKYYCIPYKLKSNETQLLFGLIKTYNITIDLKPEAIEFANKKVNERLELEYNKLKLEKSFSTPVKQEIKEKEPQKQEPLSF